MPIVSVLLPVYNCETYVTEAIQSILNQTFSDFELIVINDGSSDGSLAAIEKISDSRLTVITHENKGLSESLNIGLRLANAPLIARMDADDLSTPDRLAKQVTYLDQHPEVSLVGSHATILSGTTLTNRVHQHPCRPNDIRAFLCLDNPFVHSSVMFRKKLILGLGGYSSTKEHQPEDYFLWSALSQDFSLANLPEKLVAYRELPNSISKLSSVPFPFIDQISFEYLKSHFNFVPSAWLRRFSAFIHFNKVPEARLLFLLQSIVVYLLIIFRFRPLEKPTWKKILGSFKRLLRSTLF